MVEHTQVPGPPSGDDTVPMRRLPSLNDTQPSRRVPRPSAASYSPTPWAAPPAPSAAPGVPRLPSEPQHRRRRSCLASLFLDLLLLLAFVAAGLGVAGYLVWEWTATVPRVNVLILGLDRRPQQSNVVRSDTIVLATVYPAGPRAALLSIPRDLYVEIPGHGTSRINTAHFWGENQANGNGPALAIQTVAHNFGVQAHRYVRLDFDGFRAIVDAVGGLDVFVEKPIVDNAYPTDDYGTMRIEIPAGLQHMDGETALRYARSRHGSSDFDRAQRQQQTIVALARRLLEPEVYASLPVIYRVVTDNVDTDVSFPDVLLLAPTLFRVGPDGIEHYVIDREMTRPWTTPTGGAVLLPRWEVIIPLVQELFTP